MIRPYPYQREAVVAVRESLAGGIRRPAVVMATGLGKTVCFAALISEWLDDHPGRQAVVLVHRDELAEQAVRKLHAVAPHLRVGVVKARRDEVGAQVVVASVPTLRSEVRRRRLRAVGLIVVDECHHATAPTYRAILDHFGALDDTPPATGDGRAVAVGFTATMDRGDGASLGDVWQKVVFERDIRFGIQNGFLVDVRGIRIRVADLDLASVRRSGGDYQDGALGTALEDSMAPAAIARAYAEHAPGRQGILFAPTVHSAEVMGDALRDVAGISSALVHGAQPIDERRGVLADFERGGVQVVTNCMVLTEGTDLPPAAVAVIARPTTNAGLYVQMVGRVLRTHPGKRGALVLDVSGTAERHSLQSLVNLIGDPSKVMDIDPDAIVDEEDEFRIRETREERGSSAEEEIGTKDGPLVWEEVDLFHGSRSAWLRSRAGVWFLPTPDRFIAILPSPVMGAWDVVAMHKYRPGTGQWIQRTVEDLGYAMAHAEGEVTAEEASISAKAARWRSRPPTDRAREYAMRFGIEGFMGTGGELADEIAIRQAAGRIDTRIPPWAWDRLAPLVGV